MSSKIREIVGIFLLSVSLFCSTQAAVVISDLDTTYSQDFSSLPSTGTTLTWVNNSTISGWYREYYGSTIRDYSIQTTSSPSSGVTSQDGLLNVGEDGSTDRALVMRRAYSLNGAFGMVLENDSGTDAVGFSLSYTGEQWRRQGEDPTSLYLEYAIVSTHDPVNFDIRNDYTWTRVDALEFISPRTGSSAGLNGNFSNNRTIFSPVSVNASVADGQFLAIRWYQDRSNTNGVTSTARHALGVNNMSVSLIPPASNQGALANYDFENYTAGELLTGGVGTARSTSGRGNGAPINSNSSFSNVTVSAMTTSTSDLDSVGANIRSDTVAATVPGGNIFEISPHRLDDQNFGVDLSPTGAVDYLSFSIQADSGYVLNLDSFSFDMGVARGSTDTGAIAFRAQGWYSLDGGTNWIKLDEVTSVNNNLAQSFTEFTTVNTDLSGITALQNQSDQVLIALSLGDNSGRSAYQASSTSPAAYYLDNIKLNGSVEELTVIPEGLLVAFDFENHTAGELLQGGVVGTNRNLSSGFGDGFDFTNNGANTNLTVSVLSSVNAGSGSGYNIQGANIREDVINGEIPDGKFIEFNPWYMQNQVLGAELYPTGTVDYMTFSVQAVSGQVVNVESISIELGIASGSTNTSPVEFSVQGWYSSDEGVSWGRMGDPSVVTNAAMTNFTGFTSFTQDVSSVSGLQNVSGELQIALSIADNSSRSLYTDAGSSTYSPGGLYFDNLVLNGTVTSPPAATRIDDISIEGSNLLLTWSTIDSSSYNVFTKSDLVFGSWGVADTVLGTGGSITWTSIVTGVESRFYKVERGD